MRSESARRIGPRVCDRSQAPCKLRTTKASARPDSRDEDRAESSVSLATAISRVRAVVAAFCVVNGFVNETWCNGLGGVESTAMVETGGRR
jgi:hypothetical protein